MARIDHDFDDFGIDGPSWWDLCIVFDTWGVSPPPTPLSVAVTPSPTSLSLVFSNSIDMIAPSTSASAWRIIGSGGNLLPITNLSFNGVSTITLTTGEHATGESYALVVPSGILDTSDPQVAFPGLYVISYTGVGTAPTVLQAVAMSYRSVRVTFDEAVVESEALNKNNYAITGGVYITGVTKISDTIYELSTSPMVGGTSYTVTASNIHDMAGNLI